MGDGLGGMALGCIKQFIDSQVVKGGRGFWGGWGLSGMGGRRVRVMKSVYGLGGWYGSSGVNRLWISTPASCSWVCASVCACFLACGCFVLLCGVVVVGLLKIGALLHVASEPAPSNTPASCSPQAWTLAVRCTAGGKIGLIDYGQSKRLPDSDRAAFAHLVLAMDRGDQEVRAAVLRCAAQCGAVVCCRGAGTDE